MYVPVLEYPQGIEQVSQEFVDRLSESQLEYFKKYLTGLTCSVNKTISGINRLFVFDQRNQSSFNRFFTASRWDKSEINRGRLELLQREPHTRPKKKGVVIIDDTHNEKYGQQFEMIAKLYDHSRGYYHWAHDLVTAHYSDEKTDYPLGFRTYEQMAVEPALSYLDGARVLSITQKWGMFFNKVPSVGHILKSLPAPPNNSDTRFPIPFASEKAAELGYPTDGLSYRWQGLGQ